jgi:hypothetical protein
MSDKLELAVDDKEVGIGDTLASILTRSSGWLFKTLL